MIKMETVYTEGELKKLLHKKLKLIAIEVGVNLPPKKYVKKQDLIKLILEKQKKLTTEDISPVRKAKRSKKDVSTKKEIPSKKATPSKKEIEYEEEEPSTATESESPEVSSESSVKILKEASGDKNVSKSVRNVIKSSETAPYYPLDASFSKVIPEKPVKLTSYIPSNLLDSGLNYTPFLRGKKDAK